MTICLYIRPRPHVSQLIVRNDPFPPVTPYFWNCRCAPHPDVGILNCAQPGILGHVPKCQVESKSHFGDAYLFSPIHNRIHYQKHHNTFYWKSPHIYPHDMVRNCY